MTHRAVRWDPDRRLSFHPIPNNAASKRLALKDGQLLMQRGEQRDGSPGRNEQNCNVAWPVTPNVEFQGRDAALSRRAPWNDGLDLLAILDI